MKIKLCCTPETNIYYISVISQKCKLNYFSILTFKLKKSFENYVDSSHFK